MDHTFRSLSVLSLNVRGLRDVVKRKTIFYFVREVMLILFFYKKHIQEMWMKIFGRHNGEIQCSTVMAVTILLGSRPLHLHLHLII